MIHSALIATLFSVAANAEPWTVRDTALETTGAALHLLDWSQTLYGVRQGFSESNPILGRHPTEGAVYAYFAGTLLAHVVIARLLPQPWRGVWQGLWIGIEATSVARNFAGGVRLAWP